MTYLEQVERLLDLPPAEKSSVIREMNLHLKDICEELVESGMDAEDAKIEAEKRMGPAEV